MHDLADILHATAWPLVALLALFLLLRPVSGLIDKLAKRIETANELSLRNSGFTLKGEIGENTLRIATLEITQKVGQVQTGRKKSLAGPAQAAVPEGLLALAKSYRDVNLSNYAARVSRKDQLANEMGAMAIEHGTPRDLLANSHDDGLIVALATVVLSDPLPEDVSSLLRASDDVTLKHVAYRVVLALSSLTNRHFVEPDQEASVRAVFARLKTIADEPLLRVIKQAEWSLATVFGTTVLA